MRGLVEAAASPMAPQYACFELPPGEYAGYVFDCDGTLADSMPLHHAAWQAAFRAVGAAFEFDWDRFQSRAGKTLELTVEELNLELGVELDPARVAALQRAEYQRLEGGVRPIEPVVDFLRSVADRHPVSVASGSARVTVERTLRALGIFELVPWIVTSEEVARGKPHPDLFLLAAERMGVPPRACLVFEDSPLGIQGAEAAGMTAVLVRAGAPTHA